MTQPPESISVTCPKCQHEYKDWYRSLGFGSESFDEEYIEQCNSAVCPQCQYKVYFDVNHFRLEWE